MDMSSNRHGAAFKTDRVQVDWNSAIRPLRQVDYTHIKIGPVQVDFKDPDKHYGDHSNVGFLPVTS